MTPFRLKENQIKNDLQFPVDLVDDEKLKKHCLQVSCNRSKNNLFRIARSNNCDIFATFTFKKFIITRKTIFE